MKILIDLTSLADNFSGMERYAACHARELIKHDDMKYILVFKGGIHPYFSDAADLSHVKCVVIPACSKLVFNQYRLPSALRKIKADCYLFPAFPVPVLTNKARMVCVIHDVGVWDCPETIPLMKQWYFKFSLKNEIKKGGDLITVSEFSRSRIAERLGIPKDDICIVHCGVDEKFLYYEFSESRMKEIRAKYDLPEKYLLSLSTLEPRKNLGILVNAYSELVSEGAVDLPLVLAGRKGWMTKGLFSEVDESIRERILFTGFIDEEDLPYLYGGAELFVFPSKYEGFGIPPLEAMACGLVVVSSDAASMPEVLGDAALFFESENKESLKGTIVKAINLSSSERDVYIKKGEKQVSLFNWEKEAEKLYAYLKGTIGNS